MARPATHMVFIIRRLPISFDFFSFVVNHGVGVTATVGERS